MTQVNIIHICLILLWTINRKLLIYNQANILYIKISVQAIITQLTINSLFICALDILLITLFIVGMLSKKFRKLLSKIKVTNYHANFLLNWVQPRCLFIKI